MIKIGLLGHGTVGSATYQILQEQEEQFSQILGQGIEIKRILVRNLDKYQDLAYFEKFTNDIEEIIQDPEINLIIELTGEVESLYPQVLEAMTLGKNIITGNKALVSQYFEEIMAAAKKSQVAFRYEAAVAGAVPIIASLEKILPLNQVTKVEGVLNGTCNFILSQMEAGLDYAIALKEAQAIGFAEADPSADVEGYDTLRKLRILATLAFDRAVTEQDIYREGISHLSAQEVTQALGQGMRYKLVGQAEIVDNEIQASVKPQLVAQDSILGGLNNGENAVIVTTSNAGELVFKGLGAGGRPTAFAVLSDILSIYQ